MFLPDYYKGYKTTKDKGYDRLLRWIREEFHDDLKMRFAYAKTPMTVGEIRTANKQFDEKVISKLEALRVTAMQKETVEDASKYNALLQVIGSQAGRLFYRSAAEFCDNPESRIYKVSPLFAKALMKMGDEVKFNLLPDTFSAYVPVPRKTLYNHSNDEITDLYLHMFPYGNKRLMPLEGGLASEDHEQWSGPEFGKYLSISYVANESTDISVKKPSLGGHVFSIKEGDSLATLVRQYRELSRDLGITEVSEIGVPYHGPAAPDKPNTHERNVLCFAINFISYIHSLDPDVSAFKPNHLRSANENKKLSREFEEVDTSYPTTFVSWNYGKDRTYHVDSTWVDAHLVWQRCGPGHKDTKLIMRSGHERHYNKQAEVKYETQAQA